MKRGNNLIDQFALGPQTGDNSIDSIDEEEDVSDSQLYSDYNRASIQQQSLVLKELNIQKDDNLKHILLRPKMVNYKNKVNRQQRRGSVDLVSIAQPDFIKQVDDHIEKLNNISQEVKTNESNLKESLLSNKDRIAHMLSGNSNQFIYGMSGEFKDA